MPLKIVLTLFLQNTEYEVAKISFVIWVSMSLPYLCTEYLSDHWLYNYWIKYTKHIFCQETERYFVYK